ncbi:MAG: class II fructose-bisphosphate aldolase [Ignavibacteriaceae bacterium]|nr:class II fructose-bisphosphate aldolase [Ignavibacteriaceae bacterium]
MDKAKDEYYAVGGFNFNNLEFLQGIIEGAEAIKLKVIEKIKLLGSSKK